MEDYQRALIGQMTTRLDLYESGDLSISKLVQDLRGLFDAADPHERIIHDSFEHLWSDLDAEADLRTEPWAPPGLADDAHLAKLISALRSWIAVITR
ncbi:hypothetical protein [Acrocarpospora catenulata]|uniref:hypothetical protein n=1 Tax=Acrocarpospora catenulata TaxID=2836182 RepID=UPI001BD98D69|nr:hypothetical protein [Acrocarpospora catenulata]